MRGVAHLSGGCKHEVWPLNIGLHTGNYIVPVGFERGDKRTITSRPVLYLLSHGRNVAAITAPKSVSHGSDSKFFTWHTMSPLRSVGKLSLLIASYFETRLN
jgi:hypothetical protein